MPSIGLRYRRTIRRLRSDFTPVRGTGIAIAVVLLAALATLGVRTGADSDGASEVTTGERAGDATTTTEVPGAAALDPALGGGAAPGGPGAGGSGGAGGARGASGQGGGTGGTSAGGKGGPLTASDRGVTATSVKVVFPYFDFTQVGRLTGTAAPIENQEYAIKAYVEYVNANGGIGGRKIDPTIVEFNPLNNADMRAKCIKWADDDKVFAVVDSEAWHSGHQLCLTEEKDTPLVTSYTTVKDWTDRGAPYLWWTAPTAEDIIEHWVLWAKERNLLDNVKIGVVLPDREEDKMFKRLVQKALSNVRVSAHFEEVPNDNSAASAAMPGVIQRMKLNAERVFMLLPFTHFKIWLTNAESQAYFPHYLFSDMAQTMIVAETLLASQHPRSVDKGIGPTYARLGEKRDGAGRWSYDASEKLCADIWQKAYPSAQPMFKGGVAARWCQNIFVFVEAARRATAANGGALTRRNWAEAMATIQGYDGAMAPALSWAPGDYAGPTKMKIAEVSTDPGRCAREVNDRDTGGCLIEREAYGPIRRF